MAATLEFHMGKEFSYEDLQHLTDNFSEDNFIGRTQFGMLYKGKISQSWKENIDEKCVTVKMWKTQMIIGECTAWRWVTPDFLLDRVKDEIRFMGLPFLESNQNVAKVLGHCFEENKLGVVYDLKPLNTVRNIVKDKEIFGWRNRIKVALGLARLLKLLHWYEPQYLVRNLSAAHVIVDQDFNPVVVDFAMILGGDIGGENSLAPQALASYGYNDAYVILTGNWTMRSDVFNFGVILLELITKHTCDSLGSHPNKFIDFYARKSYGVLLSKAKDGDGDVKCLYVHRLLEGDPDFNVEDGTELTMIALDCVKYSRFERPHMEEVLSKLEKLRILNCIANRL